MKKAKLKVYGWQSARTAAGLHPDGQEWNNTTREIMAAASEAAVARAAPNVTRPRQLFNLTETGNTREIEVAMSKPGTIFWQPLNSRSPNWIET